ncbi:hypothetical protein [Streptomyces clavifer]|uniref:hypothetical protein n=1 Tax=Streptomyces clavifer TaxID=68188 RepID=UPI00367C8AB2
MSLLVEAFGGGAPDAASSQVTTVLPRGVGLVRQDMVGRGPGSADSDARYGNLLQNSLERGPVTVVSGCQDEGEGPASFVGGKVDLGGESAVGTSQSLADLTTSSSRTVSFLKTGSTWFVPPVIPF